MTRNFLVRKIYEDDDLLVLDKPAGLVVDLAETVKGETLIDWLRSYYDTSMYPSEDIPERMGLVHRLDKDTSGIILVAKTKEALKNLQKQFKERQVKKEYLALVHGLVLEGGRVKGEVGRNPKNREKFTVLLGGSPRSAGGAGKEAETEYEPIQRLQFTDDRLQEIFAGFNKIQFRKLSTVHYNLYTLLRCKPRTGRTHQIRVHLKYIGHPIVSDDKYGGRKTVRLDKRWCPRMFLHAARIGFKHPVSGEWMELESELPEDLSRTLAYLTN